MPKEEVLSQDTELARKSKESVGPDIQHQTFRFSGRYKIIKDLGEGGISRVYQAYDLWKKKHIALKIPIPGKDAQLLGGSLKNEFLLLTQLRHPGVVEVFDFGYARSSGLPEPTNGLSRPDPIQGEVPYFTMEFVEGRTLGQVFDLSGLKDSASPQSEELYHFLWRVCDILEYLHLRELVHCDLKPDNFKITDRIFNVKLLDFGLSEKIGAKRNQTAKGTLPYMAPEMFSDEPLDARTDLYSLGVILYQLATSKLPFFSDDPVKIVSAHLESPPVPPKQLNPNVNEALNQLILKLLEKSPSKRPQSASEVKEFATAHLKGHSVMADEKNFLGHLYSGKLVAREDQEAQVARLLKESISLGGRMVLLGGEQGAGKTCFLKNLRTRCQLEGALYVDSNCLENQTRAYQPVIDILRKIEPYLQDCDPGLKEKLDQALGSISQRPDDKSLGSGQEQFSAHQKVIECLIGISQVFPTALVIDNLQWADFQTLRFLSDFGQNIERGKILLACAFRPKEIGEKTSLGESMDGWRGKEWCRYIKLDRLNCGDTKTFIRSKFKRDRFPEGFFGYMHQNTSGNPFFLTEVLKYLLEKKIIYLKDCGWEVDSERLKQTSVPDTMETILLKNLERYDQESLDFLDSSAVMGKKFDSELARKLHLVADRDLSKILLALTEGQVLIKTEGPPTGTLYYEFANQSLQSLLYRRLGERKKVTLHERIAKLLEEGGFGDDEEKIFEIGHHYLESQHHEEAYRYALLSAEKMARRFANQEVLEYLGVAIGTASEFEDKEEGRRKKTAALMRRADFHKQIGDLNQALTDYQTILRLTKNSPDHKMIAEAYNGLGDTYRLKHEYKKGLSCLKKALKIRQELGDSLQIANTLHNIGTVYGIDSQYDNALSAYEKALGIYKSLGSKFYIASTLNAMGELHRICHRYRQAMSLLQEALMIKRELGIEEEIARGLNNMGATHFDLGEYPQAIDCYLESLRLNEKIKNKKEITFNLENLGEAYRKIGDYQNALKYCERGLELALEIDFAQRAGRIFKELGITYFELGHYQKAYEHLDNARTIAQKIRDKELQVLVLINLSKLFVTLNLRPRAEDFLEQATKIINQINDQMSLISVYQIKGWLKNKEETFEESVKLLNRAADLAKSLGSQEEMFDLNLDLCEAFVGLGEKDEAAECLNAASSLMSSQSAKCAARSGYLPLEPRLYMNLGRVGWLRGDTSCAQSNFEVALDKAQRLTKPEVSWQVHHLLGKLSLCRGDYENAYYELKKAGKILKTLSQNTKDEELKRNYLEDQRKKELLSDLKNAAKRLVGNMDG